MSDTKFTKGEWVIKEAIAYKNQIKVKDKKGNQGKIIGNIRTRDDANLIAAAPDMYSMLNDAMVKLSFGDYESKLIADDIKALIAKARGES